MKRALGLLILVAVFIAGLFSISGALPFVPILGVSMEPEFKAGDLITIEEVSPSDIEVGDVIVFTVPPMVREAYDYPEVVVHRVVRAYTTDRDTTFRTQGDNVEGEDPFMVRARDIKGTPGRQIPYLGFPLLYLQSQHGLIFVVVSLCLLTLYLYAGELRLGSGKVQKRLLAPVIEENRRSSHLLEQRIETTGKGMVSTERALTNFASAIQVYAEHLNSHTSAIQGLSEASHELKHSAAEQNKVLHRLAEVMDQIVPRQEEEAREQVENESAGAVPEACQKAEGLTRTATPATEEQGQDTIRRADDNLSEIEDMAESEGLMAGKEDEQSTTGNGMAAERETSVAEGETKEDFVGIYEGLIAAPEREEDNGQMTATSIGKEETYSEPHEPPTGSCAREDETREEAGEEQTPVAEEQPEEEGSALYEGKVELTIHPPIGLLRILRLYRSISSIAQAESLDLQVFEDRGITYSFILKRPTPLIQVLGGIPDVDEICVSWEGENRSAYRRPTHRHGIDIDC